jgi:hypothetical protein
MSKHTDGANTEPLMTALADPPLNGAELATKTQLPSARWSSAASSRAEASDQTAVRVTRAAAALITVVIAVASFVLSFSSLWNLAARSAWPARLAWLWPVIVDGTIVLATMAIVTLASCRDQRGNRRYFWAVLCAAAVVSVSGNAVHALIPGMAPLVPWQSAVIACVPPIALLATTHTLAILWRLRPANPADAATQMQESALAVAVSRVQKWDAVAAAIHERGQLTSHPTATISEVLRYLHDHKPPMSQRAIGAQVDLHHDTVGKIREAAAEVLGVADETPG